MKLLWSAAYILSVLAVNVAFARCPGLNWIWSIAVGSIFVTRDFCQRSIGHWVVFPMAAGLILSYLLASPFVALASAAAFAASETTDWIVFTVTKRPLADRVLLSCGLSAPTDSVIFLGIIGALSPWAFSAQVASKLVAARGLGRVVASARTRVIYLSGHIGAMRHPRLGFIISPGRRRPTRQSPLTTPVLTTPRNIRMRAICASLNGCLPDACLPPPLMSLETIWRR